MKKATLICSLLLCQLANYAQDELRSRKGEPFLPEAGDWAVQVDATPVVNFLGNMFNNAGTNSIIIQPLQNYPFSIAGKYFYCEDKAYRAKAMINLARVSTNNLVTRDNQPAPIDPNLTVTDSRVTSGSTFLLGFGIEKRKGRTRLQGFYGGEALAMYGSGINNTYNYGNPFGADNPNPASTDFETSAIVPANRRITEDRAGASFGIGARGFVGAEYFIIPKLAIGFEYGIGFMFTTTGDGREVYQSWDTVQSSVTRATERTAGGNSFGVNTDISGGALTLTFHF
jgi:hypothetical protein